MIGQRSGVVGFAALAVVLSGVSMVAGRFGVPAASIAALVLVLAVIAFSIIGALAFSMRVSTFQVAARQLGGPVQAALLIAVTLGVLSASGLEPAGLPGAALAVALALLAHGLFIAPALARAGGSGIVDLLDGRFCSRIVALLAAVALLLAVGPLAWHLGQASVSALVSGLGLPIVWSRGLVAGLCVLAVLPGGLRGVAACAAMVTVLACVGWLAPLLAWAPPEWAGGETGAGVVASRWIAVPLLNAGTIGLFLSVLGGLIGLNLAQGARDARGARRSAIAAAILLPLLVFVHLLAGDMARARTEALGGRLLESVPGLLFASEVREQVVICGARPADAEGLRRACAARLAEGKLPAAAVVVARPERGRWLATILALPVIVGALFDLVTPFVLVLAFALLVHRTAGLIVHDGLYRLIGRQGTASGRLALQRALALGLAGVMVVSPPPWPAGLQPALVELGLFLLASVPLPLMLLALWRRADGRAALCGLLASGLAVAALWLGHWPPVLGLWAGPLAGLLAGGIAAWLFPAADQQGGPASAILNGTAPGPLVMDRTA